MKRLFIGAACLVASLTQAAPYLPEQLQLISTMNLGNDLLPGRQPVSTWFPRTMDGNNYVNQINEPGFGRYPSGSSTATLLVDNFTRYMMFSNPPPYGLEHRTILPFRDAHSTTYILGSGTSSAFSPTSPFNLQTNMSRYDFDGSDRVDILPPWRHPVESFDWVDTNTIIFTSQNFPVVPALNGRLFLADVVANPFSMSSNTTWNPNGFITTSVVDAGIQVRVGSKYSGYAYYGGNTEESTNGMLFALNLATGAETQLGNEATLTGKFVRMVVERDGYLYVEVRDIASGDSSDNEIRVYNMTSATALGSLYTTYPKELLDALTGNPETQPIWGLDLTPDGTKLVIGTKGKAFELGGAPLFALTISRSGTDVVLSWLASFAGVFVQSSPSLSPPDFSDLSPQPAVMVSGNMNTATIPLGSGNVFYRLRMGP